MAGRLRRPRRRPVRRPKQVKVPTNMYVADTSFTLTSLGALSNNLFTIFDNSGTAGNKTVVFTKLTVNWGYRGSDSRFLLMAVGRQKEGGSALDLDDPDAVRDYINEGHNLRGPWMMPTKQVTADAVSGVWKWKTLVFKKLMLDSNDDLVLHVTPVNAQSATAGSVHLYYKGFYRIVD